MASGSKDQAGYGEHIPLHGCRLPRHGSHLLDGKNGECTLNFSSFKEVAYKQKRFHCKRREM